MFKPISQLPKIFSSLQSYLLEAIILKPQTTGITYAVYIFGTREVFNECILLFCFLAIMPLLILVFFINLLCFISESPVNISKSKRKTIFFPFTVNGLLQCNTKYIQKKISSSISRHEYYKRVYIIIIIVFKRKLLRENFKFQMFAENIINTSLILSG